MEDNIIKDTEKYRDKITTLDKEGHRRWMYPKKPKGKFTNYRNIVAWILLGLLFILPFVKIGGNQIFLFNIFERQFVIFGMVFTPQDLHLFAIGMIIMMLFIILFTVTFGRLFCGWICPQTVFMENVYRRIEYAIEGSNKKQIRLNEGPWTNSKIFKKTLKHIIFILIALASVSAASWFIVGKDNAFRYYQEGFVANSNYFIPVLIISAAFYFIFAFFREQVCTNVCPYGRMQGVLLVPDTIVVHYDHKRGEPRGKMHKKNNDGGDELGDCIDCNYCVDVCPTGIDIRNGTQLECINCTACMDACNDIMEKIDRPKGLIRYDSSTGIESGRTKVMTTRTWAYSGVLAVLLVIFGFLMNTRTDVETLMLKVPGSLFNETPDGKIVNMYKYEVINKTNEDIKDVSFKMVGIEGKITISGEVEDVKKLKRSKGNLLIEIDNSKLVDRKTNIIIEVYSEGVKIDETKTTFLGPYR